MDALDPDSCYLTPEQYSAFKDPSSHAKPDIGVELSKRYYLQVVAVLAGSPAEAAGVEPGDLIKSIDGENTREVNVIVGDSMLKGAAGSEVSLEIIRGRQADPLEIKVARRDVVASPVSFELLEDGTGYIKITSFRSGVEIDTKRGIELLKKQGARAIVLDVRNSFGRLAEDGARVAELFIDGGLAARLQSRKGETSDLQLDRGSVAFSGPVALLINRGSSGAAEILASAFRTAKRGEILGVPTSGRVGVQKAISLGDGSGLVLSVAQYWTADGKALLGEGLEPTIEVAGSEEPESEDADPVLDKALEVLGEVAQKKAA